MAAISKGHWPVRKCTEKELYDWWWRTEACHYEERLSLQMLGLTSLETRRLRGDLMEVFQILKVFDNIKYTQVFTMSDTGLRG